MRKIRMAVIGAGFWGRNHIRVLSEISEVELVAVCDINKDNLKLIGDKYNVKTYTDSAEMLEDESIDAVNICVWSTKLSDEALKALKSRKHVFVEKPMASSIAEAERIIKTAEKNKVFLSVGFIERFNPGVIRLKKLIEDHGIGIPVSATVTRVSKWPERIGDVGVVKDTAIHDIDIMRFIFEKDPEAVFANIGSLNHRFEDYAQILLLFPDGKSALIESNWLTPYKVRKLKVTGSEGIATVDYITQEITIETPRETLTPRGEWQEPLKLELKSFVDCIIRNNEPMVTGIDGLKALSVAEAALKSAQTGRVIRLSKIS
ncbi:Gfo/Idh/MocA family oxidoreductase [Candidatus Bathyarchaeota archaeon]|nr:Gfo/Idh/MocA family oxidoreductase [Candidatus Bathyarchaeota archaeon]MBS7631206.1 Gfo/Idh/MocA family oxidoreductase [Candidatus Bathyarchaeota archaeon]